MESELFGYEKGSFTGATKDKSGILEGVGGGTVFFDEIHQLSLTAQAKLLRVFQEKKIRRVGGTREIPVKFRLVAAAKPNLEKIVREGDFLADLYHRLAVLTLTLPPLRDRLSDLEPLVNHFTGLFHSQSKSPRKGNFLLSTIKQMRNYDWPGNIRELQNIVYRLLTDYPGENISPEHLDGIFFVPRVASFETLASLKGKFETETRDHIAKAINMASTPQKAAETLGIDLQEFQDILQRLGIEKWR
jgi:transcriptional regulator with PAS, ATPase and Fis domain